MELFRTITEDENDLIKFLKFEYLYELFLIKPLIPCKLLDINPKPDTRLFLNWDWVWIWVTEFKLLVDEFGFCCSFGVGLFIKIKVLASFL